MSPTHLVYLIAGVCYRGDVTVRTDSQMGSCLLESEGDTEDDETDGTGHTPQFHTRSCLHSLTHTCNERGIAETNAVVLILDDACREKSL